MCLECLTVLLNPDVALDISIPLEKRLASDCPGPAEAAALVAAVLACMSNLGGVGRCGEAMACLSNLGGVGRCWEVAAVLACMSNVGGGGGWT